MLSFEKYNCKLCEVLKTEDVKLPWECILFRQRNVQSKGAGWKGSHGLRYDVYLISYDLDLNDAAAFVYGDCM